MNQSLQCMKVDMNLDDEVECMFTKFFFFSSCSWRCSYPTVNKNCPSSLQIADLSG